MTANAYHAALTWPLAEPVSWITARYGDEDARDRQQRSLAERREVLCLPVPELVRHVGGLR